MNRINYSADAELLPWEVDDYDTKDYREAVEAGLEGDDLIGVHPTGINVSRMRLPTRYDISKYYQRLKRSVAVVHEGEKVIKRAGEYGYWKNKKPEDLPDISKDFEWQITYSFPNTMRKAVLDNEHVYGGKHVTFRRLYLILCERFNEGRYFIDDYFDNVYPNTVKPEVDAELNNIKEDLLEVANMELEGAVATKRGTLNRVLKANRGMRAKLEAYERFARDWEDSQGERLAGIIKQDIIECMKSGQLQLACHIPVDDIDTIRQRIQKGLPPYPTFVATEQLINSIQLFVKIGGNRKWKTKQGILV